MRAKKAFSALLFILATMIACGSALAEDKISSIRVHGNYKTPDSEVIRIAGLSVGDPYTAATAGDIKGKLLRSGRFERAEVRARYRSIDGAGGVHLIIFVRERPSMQGKFMYGPIFSLSDEYGFTYGVRVAAVDLLGTGERIYFPLSWGGEKRASVVAEFNLGEYALGTVVNRLRLSAGRMRRENPHFEIDDDRIELGAGLASRINFLLLEAGGGWTDVRFGGIDESFVSYRLGANLDLRSDANLPRDAVFFGVGWERTSVSGGSDFNRYKVDMRGFKRLFGQSILAGQAFYYSADGSLPPYLKPFLGGSATLRGYEPGRFVGDNIALASLELRVPVSPLTAYYRAGFHFFLDSGAVFDHGTDLGEADFHYGAGAGVFLFAAVVGLKLDVAHDLDSSTRFHFSTGFRF